MKKATGSPVWSKAGGYSKIYQTSLSAVASGTVKGIVDDKYTGVYKESNSLSYVDSIPGTFYSSGGVLYLHPSDENSPDIHTFWYTTESYGRIINVGGSAIFENITFIGATEYGINVSDDSSNIGTVTVTNCNFRAFASSATGVNGGTAINVKTTDNTAAGTVNISKCDFLYNTSPTYDSNYSIFIDALGTVHPYQGQGIATSYLSTVNVEDNRFRYMRVGTDDTNSTNYNLRRNRVFDIGVHPHMHNIASSATLRIENSVYSMYGSTTGPRAGYSSAGFKIYLINNTVYAGENSVIGSGDKMWFSATDSSPTVTPSEVHIYNNFFIRDKDAQGNGGIPLELENLTLNKIFIDNNLYSYGRVNGGETGRFIRFGGTNYTLADWKAYTIGQGDSKDVNSIYEIVPANIKIAVFDYKNTGNRNIGLILGGSPAIDKGSTLYAPTTDILGTGRPMFVGPGYRGL